MSKLSITQKLIGAFGIIFVMILLSAVFIFYSFSNVSGERSNVRDWLASNFTVANITKNISDTQRHIYFTLNVIGTPEAEKWLNELNKNIGEIDAGFSKYTEVINNSVYDDEEERQGDLDTLNAEIDLWKNYKSKIQQLENLIAANNQTEAVAFLESEVNPAYDEIYASMVEDVKSCQEGLEDAVDVSEQKFASFESLMSIMGLLIVAILAFIVVIVYVLVRDIKNSVDKIVTVTEKAAQGDLSNDIKIESTDEFGTIAAQFNSVMQHMRKALGEVQNAAAQVSGSAEIMRTNINKTGELVQNVAMSVTSAADNTDHQKSAIGDTESRVINMKQSVEKSVKAMQEGLKSVQQTLEHAASGNERALATVKQMNYISVAVEESARIVEELGENSKEIGSIVEVISNIADQTNLLALNAAIEAARAGEHGRGFTVVADEVRNLAENSQHSAQKISEIITTIQKTTEDAVNKMKTASQQVEEGRGNVESTGNSFSEIVNMIKIAEENSQQVMDLIGSMRAPIEDIVNRTEKISNMSVEIAEKMESISMATGEQASSIVEIAENSDNLTELAKNMENTVHEFQL